MLNKFRSICFSESFEKQPSFQADPEVLRRNNLRLLYAVYVLFFLLSPLLCFYEDLPAKGRAYLAVTVLALAVFPLLYKKFGIKAAAFSGVFIVLVSSAVQVREFAAADSGELYWVCLLPPLAFACFGRTVAGAMAAGCFLGLVCLLFTGVGVPPETGGQIAARLRFLLVFSGATFLAWYAECTRLSACRAFLQVTKALERNALTDPLTTLGNRRDFQNYFLTNQAQSLRAHRDFAIAMLDLDHFKKVNDSYGHAVGDQVLCHIAGILSAQLRATDRVFRWGGEEFVILMPDTDKTVARTVCERIRKAVAAAPYMSAGEEPLWITVSIGLHAGDSSDNIDTQMAVADENLYKAKAGGRNRVEG